MNYQKIYKQLTSKDYDASYTEVHHIIPRCMGGTDEPTNLVQLTPEAHYVAHQLLVKIYPDNNKLIFAAHMMGNTRQTNKSYGWLRRKHATAISTTRKGKPGKPQSDATRAKISAAQKGIPKSVEHKAKLSAAKKGKPSTKKGKLKPKSTCPHCLKEVGNTRYHFDNCKLKVIKMIS